MNQSQDSKVVSFIFRWLANCLSGVHMDSRGSSKVGFNLLVGILVALISVTGLTDVLAYSTISGLQNNYNTLQAKYDALTTQAPGENLAVENYTSRVISRSAIQLNLKNIGTTDIEITDVKVNGYSNQTYSAGYSTSFTQGWNGTTYLTPNQTGPLYVYMPCYIAAINESIPYWPSTRTPTQQDYENFEDSIQSSDLNFTITTGTGHQYDFTDPQSSVFLVMAWMGTLTFSFMSSGEQLQVGSPYGWVNGTSVVYVRASCPAGNAVTIAAVRINNVICPIFNGSNGLQVDPGNSTILTITYQDNVFQSGYQYTIVVITVKNNEFQCTAICP